MKILLVRPYNLSDHIQAPLGLAYLATSLRDKHEVEILDCILDDLREPKDVVSKVKSFKPDIVGVQCYTFHLKSILEIFKGVKSFNKKIKCIVGGPHPSVSPKGTFEWFADYLDFAFVGEAETGLRKLVDGLSGSNDHDFLSNVPGLVWKESESVNINKPLYEADLDKLGFPAWDMIQPQKYPEAQHGAFYKNFPIAPIVVTRGCPYPCTFCAGNKIAGKKIRKHSSKYILDQILMLYNEYGIREFHIIDDNFTFDMKAAKELTQGIIDLNLDISWATPNGVRIDRLDRELLELMKKSGLYLISLGIESGSDRVLKLMRKGLNVSDIRNGIEMIRDVGIEIAGFFILGFPGETKEDIEETIKFSCELDLIRANFFTYLPFPGTESFAQLEESGELDGVDWDKFYFVSASYVAKGLSRKELKNLQRKAFMKFFFRPKIFIKNISQIKSYNHFKFISKRFYNWIIKS